MLGIFKIARQARQWRAERRRRAMENYLYQLPQEIQKDIGWPARAGRRPIGEIQDPVHARPFL